MQTHHVVERPGRCCRLKRLWTKSAVRAKLGHNSLNLVSKLSEFLTKVCSELAQILVRIRLKLSQLSPFVLDGFVELAHPGGRVHLRSCLDRAPVGQTLFEQSILALLPKVQRKAEPIDLRLELSEATFEFGRLVLHQLIHESA